MATGLKKKKLVKTVLGSCEYCGKWGKVRIYSDGTQKPEYCPSCMSLKKEDKDYYLQVLKEGFGGIQLYGEFPGSGSPRPRDNTLPERKESIWKGGDK